MLNISSSSKDNVLLVDLWVNKQTNPIQEDKKASSDKQLKNRKIQMINEDELKELKFSDDFKSCILNIILTAAIPAQKQSILLKI